MDSKKQNRFEAGGCPVGPIWYSNLFISAVSAFHSPLPSPPIMLILSKNLLRVLRASA